MLIFNNHNRTEDAGLTNFRGKFFYQVPRQTFTCSKSTIDTLQQGVKNVKSQFFIVNFEHISYLFWCLYFRLELVFVCWVTSNVEVQSEPSHQRRNIFQQNLKTESCQLLLQSYPSYLFPGYISAMEKHLNNIRGHCSTVYVADLQEPNLLRIGYLSNEVTAKFFCCSDQ